jgi:hypothetical protein
LYDLLEVRADASFEEIESSYARLVSSLDAGALALYSMIDDDETARERALVDDAFRTLSDPERRAAYDRALAGMSSDYPPVVVPQSPSDPSVSLGQVSPPRLPPGEPRPEPHAERVVRERVDTPAATRGVETASRPLSRPRPAPGRAVGPPPASQAKVRRLKPNLEIALRPDTEFDGTILQKLRESAAATLEDVADITKINRRYLAALEANDYGAMPALVYVRGFVCEYAKALGLDPQMVAKSYMALYEKRRTSGAAS